MGYIPFDYKKLCWASEAGLALGSAAIQRDQLPDLIQPGQKLGEITPEASIHTGIPVGTPVIASASDKACEIIGSGECTGYCLYELWDHSNH